MWIPKVMSVLRLSKPILKLTDLPNITLTNLNMLKVVTCLDVKHIRDGKVINHRRVLNKAVTNAFVNLLVDALQTNTNIAIFKYHASGTGTANESANDTALGNEVETRDVGTQEEGASPNIYKSVATHTYSSSYAITEHGLFSAATGGTLMDRTKFAPINVVANDKIEFTFTMTFPAGG